MGWGASVEGTLQVQHTSAKAGLRRAANCTGGRAGGRAGEANPSPALRALPDPARLCGGLAALTSISPPDVSKSYTIVLVSIFSHIHPPPGWARSAPAPPAPGGGGWRGQGAPRTPLPPLLPRRGLRRPRPGSPPPPGPGPRDGSVLSADREAGGGPSVPHRRRASWLAGRRHGGGSRLRGGPRSGLGGAWSRG